MQCLILPHLDLIRPFHGPECLQFSSQFLNIVDESHVIFDIVPVVGLLQLDVAFDVSVEFFDVLFEVLDLGHVFLLDFLADLVLSLLDAFEFAEFLLKGGVVLDQLHAIIYQFFQVFLALALFLENFLRAGHVFFESLLVALEFLDYLPQT